MKKLLTLILFSIIYVTACAATCKQIQYKNVYNKESYKMKREERVWYKKHVMDYPGIQDRDLVFVKRKF